MSWTHDQRMQRLHPKEGTGDQRSPFAQDRDRILYCSAFHRLAGITQIVRAGEEEVFHTRQQHSHKVAQIGRRLAEYCRREFPKEADYFGIDPEVVEAAALAHDLGHPPFGHAVEKALDRLILDKDPNHDGFEGNAQTFRILTKTSVRYKGCDGLNLTEAELMDWADDIAYSVHDLEDFHRCNYLPWSLILRDANKEELIRRTRESWHGRPRDASSRLQDAMSSFESVFSIYEDLLCEPYVGNIQQRQALRSFTSQLIGPLIKCVSLDRKKGITFAKPYDAQVLLLKQITRHYILSNPALRAQQEGQVKIVRELFEKIYEDAVTEKLPPYLPHRFAYLLELSKKDSSNKRPDRLRFTADCICSLTEREVIGLHSRLFGTSSGSVLDPIVR